jgi:hypothetical protein
MNKPIGYISDVTQRSLKRKEIGCDVISALSDDFHHIPVYTSPPSKPLTKSEIELLSEATNWDDDKAMINFVRLIEIMHRIG